MVSASTPSSNEPARAYFSQHSTAKTKENVQIPGRMINSGIKCCSVRFTILGGNPSEEVDNYDIIINEKIEM